MLAPWLSADYFNCGVAHEKAGENKEAIRNFNLYLLAAPNADDVLAVNKRIGGLQYAAQMTEEAASEQARAANDQVRAAAQLAAVYQGLDGGVWTVKQQGTTIMPPIAMNAGLIRIHTQHSIEVHGHEIQFYSSDDLNARSMQWHATFTNRHFQDNDLGDITINDDGQSITIDSIGGKSRSVWQRAN